MNIFLNQILIYTGALFILLGILKGFSLLPKLSKHPTRTSWIVLILLMIFFILGYVYAIFMVNQNRFNELSGLTSVIFGGGGIFVFIAITIASNTITSLFSLSSDLEKKVEEGSKELIDHKAKAITSSKLSALGEMAAGVAHEINNPLMIIYTRSAQMRKMCENNHIDVKAFAQHAAQIESTVERISKIIKGLRHFAQDAEKEPFENVSLAELVTGTSDLCGERFSKNEIDFTIMPIPDLILHCRSIQISQVLLNLLNNSYDAVVNQPVKKIVISFNQLPGFIEIVVTDNGPGISSEIQDKMMQPFFSTKPIGKGMGLGLSISKGILEEHQGKLYYDTTSSQTKFVMKLPT